jgi:hypothetical protein
MRPAVPQMVTEVDILRCDSSDQFTESWVEIPPANAMDP